MPFACGTGHSPAASSNRGEAAQQIFRRDAPMHRIGLFEMSSIDLATAPDAWFLFTPAGMSLIVCIGFSFGRNLRSFAATCSSDGTRSPSIAEPAANCTLPIIVLERHRAKRLWIQQE